MIRAIRILCKHASIDHRVNAGVAHSALALRVAGEHCDVPQLSLALLLRIRRVPEADHGRPCLLHDVPPAMSHSWDCRDLRTLAVAPLAKRLLLAFTLSVNLEMPMTVPSPMGAPCAGTYI